MVEQRPDRVLLSSPKDLLISIGDGVIIEAEVVDARGNPIPGAPIAWRSSPAFIAKVDQNGLVTAVSNGTTTIDVTSGGASGTQKIKVQQRATSVAMQSTRDTLWAGWPPTPFSATGIDANGNLIRRPSLTWQSSDPTVALVDDTGLVTPVAPGEVNITASSDGVAATSHLLVQRYGVDDGTNRRAIHMGGNWGTNRLPGIQELPPDYFLRLADLNVNWVGISVALFIDDSIDDSVERVYDRGVIRTFTDEALIEAIRAFRQRGFNVYLTLAFEPKSEVARHPVSRWQLGDPYMPKEDPTIKPEFWPWDPKHPTPQQFVAQFWESYTEQAVHFANLADAEGVEMFSLGTETERLFRTRTGGRWPNDFREE